MKSRVSYILLVCLLALFSACDSLIYNNQEDLEQFEEQEVYLSISSTLGAETETINRNTTDFEDRVDNLSMLVFDSFTGIKVCEYFDDEIPFSEKEKTFRIKLTTGQRDFFFVANMPVSDLESINNRSEMIAYMRAVRDIDNSLYKGATESNGFPMSRVYQNQIITEGGNIYSPKPFHPLVDGVYEDGVKLIRVVAKLEITLDGLSNSLGVKNIYYKNASRQFALMSDASSISASYNEDKPMFQVGDSYIYYMPEAMMMATNPVWSVAGHKPINYFLIETLEGTFFEIPIVTSNKTISETDYMSFATGNHIDKPDYNIYRNKHYYYQIKNLQTIEISYGIKPWVIKKNYTYMGYGYNVNVSEDGKIRISNTVNACSPHVIKLKTVLPFTFNDGTFEKVFNNLSNTAYVEYTLNSIPNKNNGVYLELYYNDIKIKEFSK